MKIEVSLMDWFWSTEDHAKDVLVVRKFDVGRTKAGFIKVLLQHFTTTMPKIFWIYKNLSTPLKKITSKSLLFVYMTIKEHKKILIEYLYHLKVQIIQISIDSVPR